MRKSKSLAILGTRGIPASYGGFETFAEELSVRLAALNYEVTVFCEKNNFTNKEEYKGVLLEYVPAYQCGVITTIVFDLLCILKSVKNFDVVYMLGYGAAPFCILPRIFGKTVWLNVDGIEWRRSKWGVVAKWYFKLMEWFSTWVPDLIIADAAGIRDHLLSRHRLRAQCEVVPYGTNIIEKSPDPDLIGEFSLAQGEYYLIVARLEPENHIKEIVDGFLSSETDSQLIIVGNIDSGKPYINELLNYRSEKVRFLGGIYDRKKLEAVRFYSKCYFHGHSVGGTNPSLLEALGCGNLVIAHDNIFNREVAESNAVYFKSSSDIISRVLFIEKLSDIDVESKRIAALKHVMGKYNWESIVADYVELIEK